MHPLYQDYLDCGFSRDEAIALAKAETKERKAKRLTSAITAELAYLTQPLSLQQKQKKRQIRPLIS